MTETKSILASRRFVYFAAGRGLSEIGDQFALIGTGLLLYDLTGDVLWIAVMWMGKAAVRLVVQPFSGTIVDRYSIGKVLVVVAVAQAVTALGMALAVSLHVVVLIGLVVCAQLLQTLDGPTVAKLVPAVLPMAQVVKGNALLRSVLASGAVVGPALGGVTYAAFGAQVLFAVNAVSFVLAATGVLALRIKADVSPQGRSAFLADLKAGLLYARRVRIVLVVLVLAFVDSMLWRAVEIVNVPASDTLFGFGAEGLGIAYTVLTTGGLVASAVIVRYDKLASTGRASLLAYVLLTGPLLAIYVWPTPSVVFAAMFLSGALLDWFSVGVRALLQRSTDPRFHGRVFALHGSVLAAGALPLAVVIQPVVALIGLRSIYGVAAVLLLVSGLLVMVWMVRHEKGLQGSTGRLSEPSGDAIG